MSSWPRWLLHHIMNNSNNLNDEKCIETKTDQTGTQSQLGRKRRRGNTQQVIHSPNASTINPQLNPFANSHGLPRSPSADEFAQIYIMNVILYFEQHNRCQLCHEPIEHIPFTIWTCGTCFLCEQCICKIYDKHRYQWDDHYKRRRPNIDMISNVENIYPSNATNPAQTFQDAIKCYICRSTDRERTCRTIMPYPCNVTQYMLGRAFVKSFGTRPVPRSSASVTPLDIDTCGVVRSSTDVTKIQYTCPHCKIVTFRYSQLKNYIRHQTVCLFRPVQCPFVDCDVTFLPRILNYASLGHEKFDSLLEISTPEITTKLEDHYAKECKHKVLCNLVDCKQHRGTEAADAKQSTRVVLVHQLHEHSLTNLKSLVPMSVDDFSKHQPIWSETEMKTKFPDDVQKCQNEEEEEEYIPAEEEESSGDDDYTVTRLVVERGWG